jgi:hypothetical protein
MEGKSKIKRNSSLYECEMVQSFIRDVYAWIADTRSFDAAFAEKEFVLG